MTSTPPSFSPSALPPPTTPPIATRHDRRPWWGFGDVLLGVPFFLLFSVIGLVAGLVFTPFGDLADVAQTGDTALLPLGVLSMSLVFQQIGQGLWPFIVSKWKGLGPVSDWRFRFEFADIGIGIGVAIIGLAGAAAAGFITSELVGLTDEASADNSQFLQEAVGTPWLPVLLFSVVVGAPFTEELFFRGLTLRALERRFGSALAVVLSALVFTLPHFTGSDWRGTAVLFSSIFAVGLVLGAAAVMTNRIASPMIAHQIFNAVGAAGAMGWFDGLAPDEAMIWVRLLPF